MKNGLLIAFFINATVTFGQDPALTQFIVVDQFGYLPDMQKLAMIRNPEAGFDADQSFEPGSTYALINAGTNDTQYSAQITEWKNGQTDASSGDAVWFFDFSSVTASGDYYILDVEQNVRSFTFRINPSVYNEVFRQAFRTFYYQRSGFAKEQPYAAVGWQDDASHIGPLQDKSCRLFSDPNNSQTERDVSGGWYDAGDYNKYTNWTANYVVELLKAYQEAPEAWTDDFNIPESGNGISDLLDEVKWGMDHLLRLQEPNGAVLSIVGVSHASPPSAASGQSLYGPPSSSATLNTSAALALGATVFGQAGFSDYAATLTNSAELAWEWAQAHPDSLFRNNDPAYHSQGLGAGQQEVDDYGRLMAKIKAATFLFELTGNTDYQNFVDQHYEEVHLLTWNFAYPFEMGHQDILLYYANLPYANADIAASIKSVYSNAMLNGEHNLKAVENLTDPYMAHLDAYTWGSNSIKAAQGTMYQSLTIYGANTSVQTQTDQAAINYLHYLHGRNPLNFVYLSNMNKFGAENSVNEFYHTWFADGSEKWDRVGESIYGPAPGFLVGGPNPQYSKDGCCDDSCGSAANNALCTSVDLSPPLNQPDQKSYKDFNNTWPLNSWSVTENSCSYQINYLRLLSKYVDMSRDCHGDPEGNAFLDVCGNCSGGNTGVEPITDETMCHPIDPPLGTIENRVAVFPNPGKGNFFVKGVDNTATYIIHDIIGNQVAGGKLNDGFIQLDNTRAGVYLLLIYTKGERFIQKLIIE